MDYVRYVHGLRVEQNTAQATIQARRVYQTALAWTGHSVEGDCSCPDAANGFFCKHQVAVGLAVLDEQRVLPPTDALDDFVQSLAHDELVELLLHLVDRDQEVRAVVMARAAAAGQAAALDPQDLVQMVNAAWPPGASSTTGAHSTTGSTRGWPPSSTSPRAGAKRPCRWREPPSPRPQASLAGGS